MSNWLQDNLIVDYVGGSEEDAQKIKDAIIAKFATMEDEYVEED